jgi:ribosomal protein S7
VHRKHLQKAENIVTETVTLIYLPLQLNPIQNLAKAWVQVAEGLGNA